MQASPRIRGAISCPKVIGEDFTEIKMKIIITGITGFLGSNLSNHLSQCGITVIGIKRTISSLHRVSQMPDIILYDCDQTSIDEIIEEHRDASAVIHTATCYGRSGESPIEIFDANTRFPLELLDSCRKYGINLFVNSDTILDQYLNLYSLPKNQFLQWGKYFSSQERIKFVNIKLEHLYGPNDDTSKFTSFVIDQCKRNAQEIALTTGNQKRDFVYIDDVVSAYEFILRHHVSAIDFFTEYEVGSGEPVSIREFVSRVHRLTHSETTLLFGAVPMRPNEIMNSKADTLALCRLGWEPKYSLESGLSKLLIEEDKQ
jgi:CDP-paratose synthetase